MEIKCHNTEKKVFVASFHVMISYVDALGLGATSWDSAYVHMRNEPSVITTTDKK